MEALVLSDGHPVAAAQSVRSALPLVERVRVLDGSGQLELAIDGVVVEACDWQNDDHAAAAATSTSTGNLPLVVLGAGEEIEVLDEYQLRRWLASTTSVSAELWTPTGFEVRFQSPGIGAVERIGGTSDQRVHSLGITTPEQGDRWRLAGPRLRVPDAADARFKFVIAAPAYQGGSGGVIALHSLCDRLNRIGYTALICPVGDNFTTHPGWDTPTGDRSDLDDAIVVYPEIVGGNPLKADRVVRWMLNRPGYVNGEGMGESPDDLLVAYTSSVDPTVPTLFLPVVDPTVYFPKDVPGSGSVVWVGKNTARAASVGVDLSSATEITRRWPASKRELAELMRGADVLFTLDTMSAICLEATLCATPVVLFPDEQWDRSTIERSEGGVAGLCWWGEDDLDACRAAARTAYPRYLESLAAADRSVADFAAHCLSHFAGASTPARVL